MPNHPDSRWISELPVWRRFAERFPDPLPGSLVFRHPEAAFARSVSMVEYVVRANRLEP